MPLDFVLWHSEINTYKQFLPSQYFPITLDEVFISYVNFTLHHFSWQLLRNFAHHYGLKFCFVIYYILYQIYETYLHVCLMDQFLNTFCYFCIIYVLFCSCLFVNVGMPVQSVLASCDHLFESNALSHSLSVCCNISILILFLTYSIFFSWFSVTYSMSVSNYDETSILTLEQDLGLIGDVCR